MACSLQREEQRLNAFDFSVDALDEIPEEQTKINSGHHMHVAFASSSSADIFSPRYHRRQSSLIFIMFDRRLQPIFSDIVAENAAPTSIRGTNLTQSRTSTASLGPIPAELHFTFDDSNKSQSETHSLSQQLLKQHIIQHHDRLNQSPIHFDTASKTSSNGKVIMVSSKALKGPIVEWTIEIDQCDVQIQEIGVCGTSDIEGIEIDDRGVTETVSLGARGVYGNSLEDDSLWYGTYNKDGQARCRKDLTPYYRIGWTAKTQIKVSVNLEKWRIRFCINGKKVRKVMSLQSRRKYYPFISFAGNCRYKISE